MNFDTKIKELKKAGFVFTVLDKEEEVIIIDLKDNDSLFIRNYRTGNLRKSNLDYGCKVYTLSELIEKEVETIINCYYSEFENYLKSNKNWNEPSINIIIDSLFGSLDEQEKKAKQLAKKQILNRFLTKFNCVTLGDSELLANKFYLMPL